MKQDLNEVKRKRKRRKGKKSGKPSKQRRQEKLQLERVTQTMLSFAAPKLAGHVDVRVWNKNPSTMAKYSALTPRKVIPSTLIHQELSNMKRAMRCIPYPPPSPECSYDVTYSSQFG